MSTSTLLPGSPETRASSLGAATLVWVNAKPLVNRLLRGEGLLLAVNLSIVVVVGLSVATSLAQAFVSTVVLALLYSLNDVYDCRRDLNDAAKDQVLARFCVQHRAQLLFILKLEKVAFVAVAFALLGARSAVAVALLFLVNLAYSAVLKGKAGLDVVWVGLWGALYAMVPGIPLPVSVFVLVGAMTSICHVFQIIRDRDADDVNHVNTSAVAAAWLPVAQLTLCCAVMGAALAYHLPPIVAASAAVPLLLARIIKSNQVAWLISKLHYGGRLASGAPQRLWLLTLESTLPSLSAEACFLFPWAGTPRPISASFARHQSLQFEVQLLQHAVSRSHRFAAFQCRDPVRSFGGARRQASGTRGWRAAHPTRHRRNRCDGKAARLLRHDEHQPTAVPERPDACP